MADQRAGTTNQTGSSPSHGEKGVTTARSVADQALSAGRDLKQRAMDAAGASSDAVKDRASDFVDAAKDVASQATHKLRQTVDDQKNIGAEYVGNLADTMRRAAREFDKDLPIAGTYIRKAASQIEGVSDSIKNGDFEDLIRGAQDFARREPTAVLGVAVLAGFSLVGFLKNSADQPQTSRTPGTGKDKIKVKASTSSRTATLAKVGSKGRGRPLAELVKKIERANPHLASDRGLSSAAIRAGDLVRTMRKHAGLSQSQLAEKLGVTQARISEIESGIGAQGPTWDLMERISVACGKTLGVAASSDELELAARKP